MEVSKLSWQQPFKIYNLIQCLYVISFYGYLPVIYLMVLTLFRINIPMLSSSNSFYIMNI